MTPENKYGKEPYSMTIGHVLSEEAYSKEGPMYDGSNPKWISYDSEPGD
jgi:hypothetical protein